MTRVKLPFLMSRCRCVASGSAEAFGTQRHLEGDIFETLFRGVCVADSPVQTTEAWTADGVREDTERRRRGRKQEMEQELEDRLA